MSEKASFAAAASQLWNQNKSTIGTKSFNISLTADKEESANGSKATDAPMKPLGGHVFGSGMFSNNGQSDKKNNAPKSASQIFQAFAAKKAEGFGSNASTSADWLSSEKTEKKELPKEVVEKPKTGEEEEINLYQAQCKFFQYDMEDKKWKERGLGNLRLNETNDFEANGHGKNRLVARSAGTQKVILNSLLFPEMVFESVSEKRIKISANTPDSDLPQLFLIQSTPAQIAQLTMLLRQRIKEETQAVVAVLPKKRKVEDDEPGNVNEKNTKLDSSVDSNGDEANNSNDSNISE